MEQDFLRDQMDCLIFIDFPTFNCFFYKGIRIVSYKDSFVHGTNR